MHTKAIAALTQFCDFLFISFTNYLCAKLMIRPMRFLFLTSVAVIASLKIGSSAAYLVSLYVKLGLKSDYIQDKINRKVLDWIQHGY